MPASLRCIKNKYSLPPSNTENSEEALPEVVLKLGEEMFFVASSRCVLSLELICGVRAAWAWVPSREDIAEITGIKNVFFMFLPLHGNVSRKDWKIIHLVT